VSDQTTQAVALVYTGTMPDSVPPLRNAFESAMLEASGQAATPLCYAFAPGRYSFLTAGAAGILGSAGTEAFMEGVAKWARAHLGTSHISSPQLRVYAAGCNRAVVRDETAGDWRYCFSLSESVRAGHMDVFDGILARRSGPRRLARFGFEPGALLVHSARCYYSIRPRGNPDLLAGLVFLDGYLW